VRNEGCAPFLFGEVLPTRNKKAVHQVMGGFFAIKDGLF
jgi:hypothetical protein